MRLLRVIIFLLLAAFLALAGYAYFGDMGADPQPMRVPVQLDLSQPAPTEAAPPAPEVTESDTGSTADDSVEPDSAESDG